MGASLTLVRFCVAGLAVALAGLVTAAVGLVSFVGLAAPALVRAAGVRRPSTVIFTAPVAGAILLWLCDGAVQTLASTSSETLPTGAITALIGGPLLLWLLPRVRTAGPEHSEPTRAVRRRSGSHLLGLLLILTTIVALTFAIGRSSDGWVLLSLQELRELTPLRWPRVVAAGAAGGLLAVTGTILQRLTGNPMASPEVIGVSAGAGLGFAIVISVLPAAGAAETFFGASLGALLVMSVVLWFASQSRLPPERLLLAGVAMSSLSSAMLTALMAIGDQRAWQIFAWLGGTGSTATPVSAVFLAALAILTLAVSLTFTR